MSSVTEFLPGIGPTVHDGETCGRFWPTPTEHGNYNRAGASPNSGDGLATAVKNGRLISSAAASPASPSPSPASGQAQTTTDGSGPRCVEFARYSDPDGCWLKTSQGCSQLMLDGSSEKWCETWPASGIASSGLAYRRPRSARLISGTECLSWATPGTAMAAGYTRDREKLNARTSGGHRRGHEGNELLRQVHAARWPTPSTVDAKLGRRRSPGQLHLCHVIGRLNPTWVEWLMGFPLGWTDCDPSVMPLCRK